MFLIHPKLEKANGLSQLLYLVFSNEYETQKGPKRGFLKPFEGGELFKKPFYPSFLSQSGVYPGPQDFSVPQNRGGYLKIDIPQTSLKKI